MPEFTLTEVFPSGKFTLTDNDSGTFTISEVQTKTLTLGEVVLTYEEGNHNHDTRYYTETETDTLLSGKSDTGHTHTESEITDLDKYTQSEVEALIAAVNPYIDV